MWLLVAVLGGAVTPIYWQNPIISIPQPAGLSCTNQGGLNTDIDTVVNTQYSENHVAST